jgi:uncharacterized protein DUF29
MYPKHNEDFYGWAVHTAQLLKDRKMNEVDFEGVIEEMEDMVSSNETQLITRLSLVISHLLKWQFQPTMRGHSWIYTIREQRKQSRIHLRKNPSLKGRLDDILEDAYDVAISKAAKETALDETAFPRECPYTFEQIISNEFYPE